MPKKKREAAETSADVERQQDKWRKRRDTLNADLGRVRDHVEEIGEQRRELLIAAVGAGDPQATEEMRALDEQLSAAERQVKDLEGTIEGITEELRRLDSRRVVLLQANEREAIAALDSQRKQHSANIAAAFATITAEVESWWRIAAEQSTRASNAKLPEAHSYLGSGLILALPNVLMWNATRSLPRRFGQANVQRVFQISFSEFDERWRNTRSAAAPVEPEDNQLLDYEPAEDAAETAV